MKLQNTIILLIVLIVTATVTYQLTSKSMRAFGTQQCYIVEVSDDGHLQYTADDITLNIGAYKAFRQCALVDGLISINMFGDIKCAVEERDGHRTHYEYRSFKWKADKELSLPDSIK